MNPQFLWLNVMLLHPKLFWPKYFCTHNFLLPKIFLDMKLFVLRFFVWWEIFLDQKVLLTHCHPNFLFAQTFFTQRCCCHKNINKNKIVFDPEFIVDQKFIQNLIFYSNFLWPNLFFGLKFFLAQILIFWINKFLDSKFFGPKYFGDKIFLNQNLYNTQHFFPKYNFCFDTPSPALKFSPGQLMDGQMSQWQW